MLLVEVALHVPSLIAGAVVGAGLVGLVWVVLEAFRPDAKPRPKPKPKAKPKSPKPLTTSTVPSTLPDRSTT